MKVEKIIIQNFGSFWGTHQVPFADQGLVFVRGENLDEPKSPSNGAGKSTLFDALDWCLSGENPKGDLAKGVINDEAKSASVLALILDGETRYAILRTRGGPKAGLRFLEQKPDGWYDHTTMDEAQTQLLIWDALGLGYTTWRAAVYRSQLDGSSFLDSTDAERKALLTALIPELQEVDDRRDQVKEDSAALAGKLATAESMVSQLTAQLQAIPAHNPAAQQAWEQQRLARLEALRSRYQSTTGQLAGLASSPPQEPPPPSPEASQVEGCLATLKQEHALLLKHAQDLGIQLGAARQQYAAQQDTLKTVGSLGPVCDRCKQAVPPGHVHQILTEGQESLQKLGSSGALVAEQHRQLVQRMSDLNAEEATLRSRLQFLQGQHQTALSTYQLALATFQKDASRRSTLLLDLQHIEAEAAAVKAEVWPGQALAQQLEAQRQQLETDLGAWKAQRQQLLEQQDTLAFWTEALGPKGIKSMILDSRIEEMTEAANAWLQALTGGTTWCRFETQTADSKGKLSEKFNVRLFRHNPDGTITERNYKSWSGGEKTRAALAVDQGLTQLLADRAEKAWDLYIADEAFRRHLDSGGREVVFQLLQALQRGSTFVVDHDHEMAAQFDTIWTVRIQNRRSQLFIGGATCLTQLEDLSSLLA